MEHPGCAGGRGRVWGLADLGFSADACQCSRREPKNRVNCGFPGISGDECFSRGCCFDSSVVGVPWCFNPLPKQELEECVMEVSARKDCGYPGISPEECESRKCCFSDTIRHVPWCFFPISTEDCHY
ncbi:TFF2 [Cervus elaphus hippelaphus]|uniref:Trefoil factor 2 n=1 Tax=Cervus elaphus hippelaphus TaxID=46360 RepID=A0A212CJP0_CEREH|nr:TFF2 [Cervus elaphus hippelaphus]